MRIFDYSGKTVIEAAVFPEGCRKSEELFIMCRPNEVSLLSDVFGFDESTVIDCADLDESVRYTSFDGYDFISMVHAELSEEAVLLREINLYVSARLLVLVVPEHNSTRLAAFETKLIDAAKSAEEKQKRINHLYFAVLHNFLADFSDMLEMLEDRMQALSERIVSSVEKKQFAQVNSFRNMAYTIKKQMRSMSYLGDQILLDENRLLDKNQARYFRNLNTRFKKLYDFAESLYNLSGEMLYSYDSRLSMKTNDTVNKLTAFTLFFGPLTVITGIYGMNFDFMPELGWRFGYPLALLTMAVVCIVLFIVLKRKKWL